MSSESGLPPYRVGDLVAVRADPARSGPVIEELPEVAGRRRYRVFHAAGHVRDYSEDQLQPATRPEQRSWAEVVAEGPWLNAEQFRARLTATRLAHPQTDHLYALQAARIRFIPFQLRPVLRFLRADRPRLLIADDVGVGKTIEAGLILKELQARQSLHNVLVLCPKALTRKWQSEMRRFDEDFRIVGSSELSYCLKEAHYEGLWPFEYRRAIVHYELARLEQYLLGRDGPREQRGLLELDPPPRFGLIVADEAHHVRNPGTATHQLMTFLCNLAEAVVMLSATPLQTHRDDLFNLLHLLRPDLFTDRASFARIVEPNRYLTAAMRHLRHGPATGEDWRDQAITALDRAAATPWGREVLALDPRLTGVTTSLADPTLDDAGRIQCLRELEEVHSLAHVVNRTRRRDIGRFTMREPATVKVPFTAAQQDLYEALLEWRRQILLLDYDPGVVRLILDTLERQAASCLPALAATVEDLLAREGVRISRSSDDPELDDLEATLPPPLVDAGRALAAQAQALPDEDPKLERLLEIARETMLGAGPGKLLVFSFFLHTIRYLEAALLQSGVRVAVVTGRVSDEERESLRARFRRPRDDPGAIDVLISSEVGCEGLDYEFCDRLVNYDIPWNPMRIEQRIGRIDRFGQQAEKVLIFNFITPGTVEERVFFRCFERLGVFRDALGDLEEILGNVVESLSRLTLDPTLTPTQMEEKARQLADNALRHAEEQRRLEAEGIDLLGVEAAPIDDVQSVLGDGRFVSPVDLRALVAMFVDSVAGARLAKVDEKVASLKLTDTGRRDLTRHIRALGREDAAALRFLRRVEVDDPVPITFDQETAADRRDVEFVTPVHPLARAAVATWRDAAEPLVARLSVVDDDLPTGRYVFSCRIWETIALRPDVSLVAFAVRLDDGSPADDVSTRLLGLLGSTRAGSEAELDGGARMIEARLDELEAMADTRRRSELARLEAEHELLLGRRLASLESSYRARRDRVTQELAGATEERIIRMKTAELKGVETDYQTRRQDLELKRMVEIVSQPVAAGVLEVRHGD